MAKLPNPPLPEDLARRLPAQILQLPAAKELWRIYFQGGSHPTPWSAFRHYGPLLSARFDHHLAPPHFQARGMLYAATEIATCVAEVFQETRLIDTRDRLPWLAGFRLKRDLPLLDLSGVWPTRAGASMLISAGRRDSTRKWSQVIYEAYPEVAGLYYSSSMHANRPAVALYERAADALDPTPVFHRELADPSLLDPLRRIAADLGYGVA